MLKLRPLYPLVDNTLASRHPEFSTGSRCPIYLKCRARCWNEFSM